MSDSGTSSAEPRKIPFWRTIFQSFRFVFTNLHRVLAIGWLPFIIIAVAFYVVIAEKVGYATITAAITIPTEILSWLAYAVFGVCWHRFVILGEQRSATAGLLAWRNIIFFGYFAVLVGVPAFAMNRIGQYGFNPALQNPPTMWELVASVLAVVGWTVYFILYRFYLLFPATAIDRPLKFGEAWRRMRGNTWRLIGATFLVALIFMLPLTPLNVELGELMTEAASAKARGIAFEAELPAYVIVLPVVYFLMTGMLVTVLSNTYLHVMGAPHLDTAGGS